MILEQPTIGIAMPTDADWGRLYKYDTTGDAGLVMPFRSYYLRPFFSTWNDFAIGFIYRNRGESGGDDSDCEDERQSELAIGNLFHFGLTRNVSPFNVANNPRFLGIRGVLGGTTQLTIDPAEIAHLKLVASVDGGQDVQGGNLMMPISFGITEEPLNPFCIAGLRFLYSDADQKVYVRFVTLPNIALADDADNITVLSEFLQNIDITSTNSTPFENINRADFNTFYIYWPYLHNKLMLQTVGAVRLA